MKRTTKEVLMRTNKVDEVLEIISAKLEGSGYEKKIIDDETVWSKGDGVVVKMQCFGAVFTGKSVILQGWLKDAITGESDLEGFVGLLPKKKMKGILEELQMQIEKQEL